MANNTDKLRQIIAKYIDVDNEEWNTLFSVVDIKTFKKGDILLYEGDKKFDIHIVLDGLLRTYFTRGDGEEKTFYFSLEGDFAADYENAINNQPSNYSIDALEDTTVAIISMESLQGLYSTLKNGNKLGRIIVEKYFFIWSGRISDFYMHSPLERYNNMHKYYPDIIQRVPQYYIASYLNISTVHLSRLKKQK